MDQGRVTRAGVDVLRRVDVVRGPFGGDSAAGWTAGSPRQATNVRSLAALAVLDTRISELPPIERAGMSLMFADASASATARGLTHVVAVWDALEDLVLAIRDEKGETRG